MNSETPNPAATNVSSLAEVGPPNPQYQNSIEKSYTIPEDTIARIRAEADRDQTSESEALIKIVAAYQPV
jgi:hypothetical protein